MELREVALIDAVGRWPRGTRGFIVDAFDDVATIEIADEGSETPDLLTLGYDEIALFDDAPQEHFPVDA
jgi:hypothetical protein